MKTVTHTAEDLANREYKYGFITDIESDSIPAGLNEDVIRVISAKKHEPDFMLDWRLKAYRYWAKLEKSQAEPKWANVHYPSIDYQKIIYYAAPKAKDDRPKSLEEVDPELLRTYEKLGIPLREQALLAAIAVDAAFDSVSVATTFKAKLGEMVIIFCPSSAAVVELVAHDDAQIKYSTVQNWYPGDAEGKGGIYNFVTKRGKCLGKRSKISWTQVETGSAITWKYPSCILQGDNSVGEFYSVALVNNYQQADTGTKMLHIGKNTRSTIISKGISAGYGRNTYRGRVQIHKGATNARNYSQCDSLLIGSTCAAFTFPDIQVQEPTAQMEHEASTSKIGEEQLFYCQARGITPEDATNMIVNGFCKQVFLKLPMEFAVEAQKLIGVSLNLEGTVG